MFGMFLDLNLQARLDCQIVRMHPRGRYDAAKLVVVYKPQLTNPAHSAFNLAVKLFKWQIYKL